MNLKLFNATSACYGSSDIVSQVLEQVFLRLEAFLMWQVSRLACIFMNEPEIQNHDQDKLYFVTFTVIHWLDVFIRRE